MSSNRSILWALVLGVPMASGCSGPDPFGDWSDRDLAEHVDALSRSEPEHATAVSPYEVLASQAQAPPPEGASVDWFIASALASNADIRAARQRVERMREKIPQATSLPDPMVTYTFGEMAETAAGMADYDIGVQQTFPFPGTLNAQGDVARQEVVEALHELQATIEQVRADVRRAYWAYFEATRESAVLEENRSLLTQINSAVDSRVRVSRASQADLLRVSRRIAKLDNQLAALEQRRATAAAMLSRLISTNSSVSVSVPQDTDWHTPTLGRSELIGRGIYNSPRVKAAQARAGTFRQKLVFARKDRLPDFMVGMQYTAVSDMGLSPVANGDDQFAATVGVTIPLWSGKYDAAEREAMRGMGEALADVRAAQDQVAFEIDESLARIEANEQMLRRLRERMMPDASQTIDVALTGYRTGDVDLLQLLEDWQDLLDDRVEEARVIAELYQSLAALEQAVGEPLKQPALQEKAPEGGR